MGRSFTELVDLAVQRGHAPVTAWELPSDATSLEKVASMARYYLERTSTGDRRFAVLCVTTLCVTTAGLWSYRVFAPPSPGGKGDMLGQGGGFADVAAAKNEGDSVLWEKVVAAKVTDTLAGVGMGGGRFEDDDVVFARRTFAGRRLARGGR